MKNITIVENIKAGSAVSSRQLHNLLKKNGIQADTIRFSTNYKADIKKAIKSGSDVIVAAGGDGTVNAVAQVLADSNATLGVLPLGTLNHFASDASVPTDINDAVACLARGKTKKVDIAAVNDTIFLNNSSIGIYPHIVHEREKHERHISKWPAAFIALLLTLPRMRRYHAEITIDGKKILRRTQFIFVGNNQYSLENGIVPSRNSMTDGILSLYIVRAKGVGGIIRLLVSFFAPSSVSQLERHSASDIVVRLRHKSVRVALDGEVSNISTPLHFSIKPKKLRVICNV